MNRILKISKYLLSIVLCLMLFSITNVYAESSETIETTQATITIDANGGVPGDSFSSSIVLTEEETYAVSGLNEDFLKAPEGKKFAGIEMIDQNGEVRGIADSVLLYGYSDFDNMTLRFHWGEPVSDINLTLEYPKAGDSTDTPQDEYGYYDTNEQTNKPQITVESEYNFEIQFMDWIDENSFNEEYEYFEKPFIGTFESGKTYYAHADIYNNNLEYAFNDVDSLNIKVNGEAADVYKVVGYSTWISIALRVKIAGYEVIKGAEQKVVSGEDAEFEIDADYSLFKDGGKVYIDDDTNPLDSSNYTSREGSTIITLKKEYVNTLSEGVHTLKVLFNDNNTATTSFTVVKNSTNTSNSKAEIEPPHTGITTSANNNALLYIIVLVLSILTISKTILLKD